MKVLITGGSGQLGYDVAKELGNRKIEFIMPGRDELDLTDTQKTDEYITACRPDAVVHCAAYTAVDMAEENKAVCKKINTDATEVIARCCKKTGAVMMYFSTDYVFPGDGDGFYEISDEKSPLNYYGYTKSLGEDAVIKWCDRYFILRISWVFGINGRNFVKTMANLSKTRDEVSVVDDQIGSPTYTADLAKLVCDMIVTDKYGVYHATNEGVCSWADLAEETFKALGADCRVRRVSTEEYGQTKARRPQNSRLSKKSLDDAGFSRLPKWQTAVKRYIEEIRDEQN